MSNAKPSAATPQMSHSLAVRGRRLGAEEVLVMTVPESISGRPRFSAAIVAFTSLCGSRESPRLYAYPDPLWYPPPLARGAMAEPLRLLMAEDSPDDAVLVVAALREGGFEPSL